MSESTSPFKQRFRYRFDNFMARGGSSIFISLLVGFLVLLTTIAILRGVGLFLFPEANIERAQGVDNTFFRHTYITFLQMTDPGNMAQDIESNSFFKIFTILSGAAGIVMLSSLIAFITTALDQKMAQLKKGHSKVIEDDHTLILGWNERVPEIIRELVEANDSEDNPVIVILANKDKEEMDDFLSVHSPDTGNTRVVTRSGVESSLANLDIASVDTCKSVVVLSKCAVTATEDDLINSDIFAIKTILALIASRSQDVELNIVAEIFLERNRKVATDISPEEVTVVDTNEILAKILVQTSRSIGLSVAYGEILSFDGCEMYFHHGEWKSGITFGEMAFHFPDGVPMGLRHAGGTLAMNPHPTTEVKADDDILILAEDDSTIEFRAEPVAQGKEDEIAGGRIDLEIERELIVGWTPKVEIIAREYAEYVLEGSIIDIMVKNPDEELQAKVRELDEELEGVKVQLISKDPLKEVDLLALEPFHYNNIIILSQSGDDGKADVERTDSETIIILLILRSIFRTHAPDNTKTKLITEILDSANQSLVAHAGVYEFIISNRFISMILAQISEDSDIKAVYDDLFQEDGSEIYLKPVELYFKTLPVEVTFADMMKMTQAREEVALGVKMSRHETDPEENFGVKLIPFKDASYTLDKGDTIVVLAEDET